MIQSYLIILHSGLHVETIALKAVLGCNPVSLLFIFSLNTDNYNLLLMVKLLYWSTILVICLSVNLRCNCTFICSNWICLLAFEISQNKTNLILFSIINHLLNIFLGQSSLVISNSDLVLLA